MSASVCRPLILEPWRIPWIPDAKLYETARHGMEPIFSDFPGILSFHRVSGRRRKSRFFLIEHQEAGMMGYLRIA
jgi:hypothetical protein